MLDKNPLVQWSICKSQFSVFRFLWVYGTKLFTIELLIFFLSERWLFWSVWVLCKPWHSGVHRLLFDGLLAKYQWERKEIAAAYIYRHFAATQRKDSKSLRKDFKSMWTRIGVPFAKLGPFSVSMQTKVGSFRSTHRRRRCFFHPSCYVRPMVIHRQFIAADSNYILMTCLSLIWTLSGLGMCVILL